MPHSLNQTGIKACGTWKLSYRQFPSKLAVHLLKAPNTLLIEYKWKQISSNPLTSANAWDFLKQVVDWGSVHWVNSKIKSNTKNNVRLCLSTAKNHLAGPNPKIGNALAAVSNINGLGISFATKVVRFICPEHCPVLDKVIWQGMYMGCGANGSTPPTIANGGLKNYTSYVTDIKAIAQKMKKIPNPLGRPNGEWYPADVEMAIYAHLRGW